MNVSASQTNTRPTVKRVSLVDMTAPDTVAPGESYSVTVRVANAASQRMDEDACGDPSNPCGSADDQFTTVAPTCVAVDVSGGGQTRTVGPRCHPGTSDGSEVREYRATLQAPETPGDYEVTSTLRLPGSGREAGPLSQTVTVTGDGGEGAVDESDGTGPLGLTADQLSVAVVVLFLVVVFLVWG